MLSKVKYNLYKDHGSSVSVGHRVYAYNFVFCGSLITPLKSGFKNFRYGLLISLSLNETKKYI